MASDLSTVEYILDQVGLRGLTHKRMFGEFGLYLDGTFVALVCDNQLYVKPTPAGTALMTEVRTGIPYPNAKPHLLIDDRLDDGEWVAALLRVTRQELAPAPAKPKATAKPKAKTRKP